MFIHYTRITLMIEFFNIKQYFSYIHDKNCLTIKQHIMKYKR